MNAQSVRRTPGMTIIDGAPISRGRGLVAFSVDELFRLDEENGVLSKFENGKLKSISVEWNPVSVGASIGNQQITGSFLGEYGQIIDVEGNEFLVREDIQGPIDNGPLRTLSRVDEANNIAAGTGLQIYSSGRNSTWVREPTLGIASAERNELSVEAIAWTSTGGFLAVGLEGLLLLRENRTWRRLESPTNSDLYAATSLSDGSVIAVGQQGTVIVGMNDRWSIINHQVTDEDFWGVVCCLDRIFVSGMNLLYELKSNRLEQFPFPDDNEFPTSTYRLRSNGEILWSVGTKELFEFDGEFWKPLISCYG